MASLVHYRKHPADFIDDWLWTYDPRRTDGPANMPFILWPRQREYIAWLQERLETKTGGLVEKSRDMGVTYLNLAFTLWLWLFHPGSKVSFGSRKEALVDRIGDPDSIFEKARMMLRLLPEEFLPAGYSEGTDATFAKIVNRQNGATITGEAGDNIGRGGRSRLYFVDESAFVERPERVDAALSQNTDVRIDVSTPNGNGNPFYRKRVSGKVPVFTLHWAQPLDAKVLTPTGWRLMGDLSVGDQVIGADGTPTPITGVFPQGEKEVFRVRFSDGSSAECCADHLWSVIPYGNQRTERKHIRRVLPLWAMMDNFVERDSRGFRKHNYQIPLVAPVRFETNYLPLDPYVLGCLVGDGSLPRATRSISFSTEDAEIARLVDERLPRGCRTVGPEGPGGLSYRISVDGSGRGGIRGRGWHNPVRAAIVQLGLAGSESHTKVIPHRYKIASPTARLELLQGLMDTDGHACGKSNPGAAVFSTVSDQLARDVAFIVQTLGGVAVIRDVPAGTRPFPGGRVCECRAAFRVDVRLPDGMVPFKLSRKIAAYRPSSRYKPRRSLVSIEPSGTKACRCISVGALDGLYLTDDCVVTHNSSDPRKDQAWYAKMKRELDPVIVASEIDIDYNASTEDVCIPASFVQSAIGLASNTNLPEDFRARLRDGSCRVGLDVADEGGDLNTTVGAKGVCVFHLDGWKEGTTTQTTRKANEQARTLEAEVVRYDKVGVGAGVKGEYAELKSRGDAVPFEAINTGDSPPQGRCEETGKLNSDRYLNLRAWLWWSMRRRFIRTYEHVNGIREYEPDQLIALPTQAECPRVMDLVAELSRPKAFFSETGKIQIEPKKKMTGASPNFADALMLCFVPPKAVNLRSHIVIGRVRR